MVSTYGFGARPQLGVMSVTALSGAVFVPHPLERCLQVAGEAWAIA
jgi:hypothetical protein